MNFSFESRKTSTKWRRFLIRTPLISLTILRTGCHILCRSDAGTSATTTTTSSSPSNFGKSPRRKASGLPIEASAA